MESLSESRRARNFPQITNYIREAKQDFYTTQRYNLSTFLAQPLTEISGSFGDIGTLLPILIALTQSRSISLSSTLVFSGLANILTGLVFGIPLPVQPMKAIAAVALARNFNQEEIASAGLFVAGAIGFLSLTGLIHWFTRVIPIPVIKGIQVGTGLSLVISAGGLFPGAYWDSAIVLALAFIALLASSTFRRVPYALLVLILGIIAVAIWDKGDLHNDPKDPSFSIWQPHASIPSPQSFRTGVLEAGIGQLPLTTLNSVIAVAFLAQDLLPDIQSPSTTSLGLSVAGINLVACWFGAMPVCHGSGGLAAQYRFGARSGASIIFLGLLKLVLGLFASEVALRYFLNFPKVLLCILVIAAGLELVKVGESLNTVGARDLSALDRSTVDAHGDGDVDDDKECAWLTGEERKRRWGVMFMTVGGILAFKNDAVGFLAGMLCHWSFHMQDSWEEWVARREGQIRFEEASTIDNSVRGIQHEGP